MTQYEEFSTSFKNKLLENLKIESGYWGLLGMEVVDIKKGWAQVRLPFNQSITRPGGLAHGGSILSIADASVGLSLLGMINKNETMVTVEIKVNFMRPFQEGEIIAEAKIIHKGNKIAFGEVEIKNSKQELIAIGLSTLMIVSKNIFSL